MEQQVLHTAAAGTIFPGRLQTVSREYLQLTGSARRAVGFASKDGYVENSQRDIGSHDRKDFKGLVDSLGEQVDVTEYARLVYLCGENRALLEGKQVHAHIVGSEVELNLLLGSNVVKMYLKCGSLDDARRTFDMIDEKDVILWTAMIAAYSKSGQHKEALQLFRKMQLDGILPNRITFITILNVCGSLRALAEGKHVHARIRESGAESNSMVASTLVSMYGKCGDLENARKVFDRIREADAIAYNVMIAAYAKDDFFKEAIQLFHRMQLEGVTPDKVTFMAILDACCSKAALVEVHKLIVESGFESDFSVATAIISRYSKCGVLEGARSVFEKTCYRDEVLWTSIVEAYAQHGSCMDALQLIRKMQQEGSKPTSITFAAMVDASAGRATQQEIKLIHQNIVESGLEADVVVATALVNMYGKCGQLQEARGVFDKMLQRTVISWNAMIAAYAQHGYTQEALQLFQEMQLVGVVPSLVSFLCVLSACSHGGFLVEGPRYFVSIYEDYGLSPSVEHYGCIIDLLGRSGQVIEAEDFIKQMPFDSDSVGWMALLGACRNRENVELGQHAGNHVLELDPNWEAGYVVLSNVYAAAGTVAYEENGRRYQKNSYQGLIAC